MQVIDDALLDTFRAKRSCELCGNGIEFVKAEPHHVASKGMGSGGRLDITLNLLALHLGCHYALHLGRVDRRVVWFIIACREKVDSWEDVYFHVLKVQAAPKEARYDNGNRRLYLPGEPGWAELAAHGSAGADGLPGDPGGLAASGSGQGGALPGEPVRATRRAKSKR